MKAILILVLAFAFIGCAPAVKTVPVDMQPIVPMSLEAAKTEVTKAMMSRGYDLRKSDPLTFEKEIPNILVRAMYATKYDGRPVFRVSFVFLPEGSSTKVVPMSEAVSNKGSAYEKVVKTSANPDVKEILAGLQQ